MRPRSVLGLVSAYEFGKHRGERRTGERRRNPLLLAAAAGLALLVLALLGALASPGAPPPETAPTSTVMPAPSAPEGVVVPQPAAPIIGVSPASPVPLLGVVPTEAVSPPVPTGAVPQPDHLGITGAPPAALGRCPMTAEDRAADLAVCDVGSAASGGRLGAVVSAVSAVGERRDALVLQIATLPASHGLQSPT